MSEVTEVTGLGYVLIGVVLGLLVSLLLMIISEKGRYK